ncbi:phosphatase PAP2 family protein [Sanguibacter inulinus]|uniref:Phosphatase PAP2 family protein n=1 Tax=Sanguibacter inulinus TaxID=60922 RepID=A0A853ERT5_9MICO|nr:phosphatase PAP2 family protein [Sanguibacter inulinus]MBF0721307.1 phosphatase PAP2 family protein [Sanguibacter inulinus]NYS92452.1 phosphatase PAP2 family protein [Sanguibacter inulinus]
MTQPHRGDRLAPMHDADKSPDRTPTRTWTRKSARTRVLDVTALLVVCAAGMGLAWALRGPSSELARSIAPTTAGIWGAGRLAEVLVIVLGLVAVTVGWRALRSGVHRAALAVSAAVGAVAAYAASEGIKVVVAADRVCRDITAVDCPAPGDWGFPSSHTVVAVAGATAILLLVRRWPPAARWAVVALAVGSGAGRVLQGVHAPHEVIAGAVLGCVTVLVVVLLLTPVVERVGLGLSTRQLVR